MQEKEGQKLCLSDLTLIPMIDYGVENKISRRTRKQELIPDVFNGVFIVAQWGDELAHGHIASHGERVQYIH